MTDVHVINLSGYMLATDSYVRRVGQKWLPYDTMVYVCKNLDVAKRILMESHNGKCDCTGAIWTTIYRVSAPMVGCVHADKSKVWTQDASKITVDGEVLHCAPHRFKEDELLQTAACIRPAFFGRVNTLMEKTK